MKDTSKYVNVENLLGPKLTEKLPRFVINYIKKIAHEAELNEAIDLSQGTQGADFFKPALDYLDITYNVRGKENLPKQGKFIFVCNHPLGGPEALIVGEAIRCSFGNDIRFIANSLLNEMKPLASVFFPVNLLGGGQKRDLSEKINQLFNSDNQVCMFPAGTCAKKIKGEIVEMPWKKAFVKYAKASQRDIIPIHCTGRNSNWYYFLSDISRLFKLKVNLGMFYLVDELFKHKHHSFDVTFGKPISWEKLDNSKSDLQWAAEIRETVIELGKK